MKKALVYIIVFLMPLTLGMMLIRQSNSENDFGSFKILYNYLEQYPVESIEDLKNLFVEWRDVLLDNVDLEPDWSGDFWEDLQQIGTLISNSFKFIGNLLKFQALIFIDLFNFLWDSLSWILNLPFYVINA